MNKSVLLAAAAGLALSAFDTASAAGRRPIAVTHTKVHASVHGRAAVLYDQNNHDDGTATISQNFEAPFDASDAQAADDFRVPDGHIWKIRQVDATGVYFNGSGPAVSENVIFYEDNHGHPWRIVAEFDGLAGIDNGFGSFAIDLGEFADHRAKLKPGRYWVSVQANLDFAAGGEWGWENRKKKAKRNPANWQNPGDGFGTGCTTWAVKTDCIAAGQGPDQMFTLRGKDVLLAK